MKKFIISVLLVILLVSPVQAKERKCPKWKRPCKEFKQMPLGEQAAAIISNRMKDIPPAEKDVLANFFKQMDTIANNFDASGLLKVDRIEANAGFPVSNLETIEIGADDDLLTVEFEVPTGAGRHLLVVGTVHGIYSTSGYANLNVTFNGDTGTNYERTEVGNGTPTTITSDINHFVSQIPVDTTKPALAGSFHMWIYDYQSDNYKQINIISGAGTALRDTTGLWIDESPINTITFTAASNITRLGDGATFSLYVFE